MKAPHESPDPLLQSLADEARDLPTRAATEARLRSVQRKENRQRLVLAGTVSVLGLVTWLAFPPRDVSQQASATTDSPGKRIATSINQDASQTLPAGLNPEQASFVKAMGDQPLLLVRDANGKVSRIHVFER